MQSLDLSPKRGDKGGRNAIVRGGHAGGSRSISAGSLASARSDTGTGGDYIRAHE
jgi:hypothetical protein